MNIHKDLEDFSANPNSQEIRFNILNKFDRVWNSNRNLSFCEMYKLIIPSVGLTDEEVSKQLTEYIDKNNIK